MPAEVFFVQRMHRIVSDKVKAGKRHRRVVGKTVVLDLLIID